MVACRGWAKNIEEIHEIIGLYHSSSSYWFLWSPMCFSLAWASFKGQCIFYMFNCSTFEWFDCMIPACWRQSPHLPPRRSCLPTRVTCSCSGLASFTWNMKIQWAWPYHDTLSHTLYRQITHSKQHFCTRMESEFFGIWGANFVLFHFLCFWDCVVSRTLPTLPEVCPQIACSEIAKAYTKNVSHSWSHFHSEAWSTVQPSFL